MGEEKQTIEDSTTSTAGGRIPKTTFFKTVWSKDIKLLQYFSAYERHCGLSIQSLEKLSRQDKLAISRHKKILLVKLGLIKEPEKVKIIYQIFQPTAFYTDLAVEKEKTFQNYMNRYDKEYCVLWTEEKQKLVDDYYKLVNEYEEKKEILIKKIMKKDG